MFNCKSVLSIQKEKTWIEKEKRCTIVHTNWLVLSSLFSFHSCFFRFKGTFFLWKGLRRHNIQNKEVTSLVFDIQSRGHLIGILPSRLLSYDILFSVCLKQDLRKKNNTTHHLIFNVCLFFFIPKTRGEEIIFCTIAQEKMNSYILVKKRFVA